MVLGQTACIVKFCMEYAEKHMHEEELSRF
jgi:hypothetical protein